MFWLMCLVAIAIPKIKNTANYPNNTSGGLLLLTDGTHKFVSPKDGKKFKLKQLWSLLKINELPQLEYLVGSDNLFLISIRNGKEKNLAYNEQATLIRKDSATEEGELLLKSMEILDFLGVVELRGVSVPKIYGPALLVNGNFIGEEE